MDEGKKVANYLSFSPRNGEVILKLLGEYVIKESKVFQSPQWGSNSKVACAADEQEFKYRFSPRNGEVILKMEKTICQWSYEICFSPRNGEVILKLWKTLLHQRVHQFQSPQWGSNSKVQLIEEMV